MDQLLKMALSSGGGGMCGPPNSFNQSFSSMQKSDGVDLFRLMSKAQKYSQSNSRRKQKKGGQYAYMAGSMMQQHGINNPEYSAYHHAAQNGGRYGGNSQMVSDFRSGARTQQRQQRRQRKGRYESRPQDHNKGKGKKSEEGGMFDFFDSDTSSSSSSSSSSSNSD